MEVELGLAAQVASLASALEASQVGAERRSPSRQGRAALVVAVEVDSHRQILRKCSSKYRVHILSYSFRRLLEDERIADRRLCNIQVIPFWYGVRRPRWHGHGRFRTRKLQHGRR